MVISEKDFFVFTLSSLVVTVLWAVYRPNSFFSIETIALLVEFTFIQLGYSDIDNMTITINF